MVERLTKDKMSEKELLQASLAGLENAFMEQSMGEEMDKEVQREFSKKMTRLNEINAEENWSRR